MDTSEAFRRSLIPESKIREMVTLATFAPPGTFVEVGVYRGGSAWFLEQIARETSRPFYAYDTFTGIPFASELDHHEAGDFNDTTLEDVRAFLRHTTIVPGMFPNSMVDMPEPIAFVHADADQYETTRAICDVFPPLMRKGGMILFDDYSHAGCKKAVDEHFEDVRRHGGRALVVM